MDAEPSSEGRVRDVAPPAADFGAEGGGDDIAVVCERVLVDEVDLLEEVEAVVGEEEEGDVDALVSQVDRLVGDEGEEAVELAADERCGVELDGDCREAAGAMLLILRNDSQIGLLE